MKAKTFVVAMIMPLVAMTFQSCPGQMIPVPETDMYAYVYNPDVIPARMISCRNMK